MTIVQWRQLNEAKDHTLELNYASNSSCVCRTVRVYIYICKYWYRICKLHHLCGTVCKINDESAINKLYRICRWVFVFMFAFMQSTTTTTPTCFAFVHLSETEFHVIKCNHLTYGLSEKKVVNASIFVIWIFYGNKIWFLSIDDMILNLETLQFWPKSQPKINWQFLLWSTSTRNILHFYRSIYTSLVNYSVHIFRRCWLPCSKLVRSNQSMAGAEHTGDIKMR